MKQDTRKIVARIFLMYAAVNTFAYALLHIAYLFTNDTIGQICEYISYYISGTRNFWEASSGLFAFLRQPSGILGFLAQPMLATVMLVLYAREGMGRSYAHILLISSARIFFTLPYYYVLMTYNYRYEYGESLVVSLLLSVLIILLSSLVSLLSLKIATYFFNRRSSKLSKSDPVSLQDMIKTPSTSDFLGTAGMPLTVFAILIFSFRLIVEIIDTAMFFIEFRSDYTAIEIANMLSNYVLLFCLIVVSYVLCARLKNRLAKYEFKTDEEE